MARIRSRHTTPELAVRRRVHATGLRFRLHRRDLPGTPDLVLVSHRIAVFVHGCFWHGHPCKKGHRPRSNLGYWLPKIERNRLRDRKHARALKRLGWLRVVIWECEIERGIGRLLAVAQRNVHGNR